ncbi:MAG: acetate--CoA ligase family protein [Aphanothece sp. CMT-3BRIN-NPC111]|jgi:succinyl-CoA synthetase beta subunit|nr:acetate--CoA ligase family protein [Aphanothece sp. CMT-3BRIN-NPC111]
MDLLEYQAKELFRKMGIPVLPSQRIDHPRDIKGLQLRYPVVLKSQVRAGGRGRAGGVRFAENTIDAIAAARTIFNLPILGEYPHVLLAEAKYDADREFYLAVVLDYAAQRPVLLGSPQGGINVEAVMQHMQQVVVDQEFSPFYARRLMLKMGLQGTLIESVSAIVEKMYQLFVQKDLDLVEINPLGVSSTNEVMALDGKIAVNDDALGRHRNLALLASKMADRNTSPSLSSAPFLPSEAAGRRGRVFIPGEDKEELLLAGEKGAGAQLRGLNWVNREGNIGIICNGTSLAIATLDLLYQAESKPASYVVVGEDAPTSCDPISPLLERALEQITQSKGIKVVLVNILSSATLSGEVAEVIATYLQGKVKDKQVLGAASAAALPHFVVRLIGGDISSSRERLADLPIHLVDNLDLAIAQTVSLAKSSGKRS